MLKIRRSHDRLIFNMGISIPGKDSLYIETGPCVPFRVITLRVSRNASMNQMMTGISKVLNNYKK